MQFTMACKVISAIFVIIFLMHCDAKPDVKKMFKFSNHQYPREIDQEHEKLGDQDTMEIRPDQIGYALKPLDNQARNAPNKLMYQFLNPKKTSPNIHNSYQRTKEPERNAGLPMFDANMELENHKNDDQVQHFEQGLNSDTKSVARSSSSSGSVTNDSVASDKLDQLDGRADALKGVDKLDQLDGRADGFKDAPSMASDKLQHLDGHVDGFKDAPSMASDKLYQLDGRSHGFRDPASVSRETDANCTLEMFGGDNTAYQACLILDALQNNWFPSPVAGLYYRSYLDWNGFDGFWQNGAILETIANFLHYSACSRHSHVFKMAGRSMEELLHAYYPEPSFDDEGWFAVSYARVYEVTGNRTYLHAAERLYNYLWEQGWDASGTCSGGMWFGGGHQKKITITNAQMLVLGAKLYRLMRNETYLERSLLTLDYLVTRVVNHTSYLLADSISPYDPDCTPLPKFNITYNTGMFIGGLVELYKVTVNDKHLELAHRVAMAIMGNNWDGEVFVEYCDWDEQCSQDQDAHLFKGIFVRNLRYLMDVSNATQRGIYQEFLDVNMEWALSHAQCVTDIKDCQVRFPDGPSKNPTRGPVFGTSWRGPFQSADVISQTSALDLFVAGIKEWTACTGPACSYNPPTPDIKPMTCADNPCEKGHQCCTWDNLYATCCMPNEQCYGGGCYEMAP